MDRNKVCHVGRGNVCIWALCPSQGDPSTCKLERLEWNTVTSSHVSGRKPKHSLLFLPRLRG